MNSTTTRRVFIAPVSEPANGAWHDLADFTDASDLYAAARASIKCSEAHEPTEHCPDCEELDCSDYEGFSEMFKGRFYVGVGEAWKAHEWLEEIEGDGLEAEIALAYAANIGEDCPDVETIRDAYAGTFRNLTAFAEYLADEMDLFRGASDTLRNYFDYEAYGRDLQLGGDVWTEDVSDGLAIFWNR